MTVAAELCPDPRAASKLVTYSWLRIGSSEWEASLFFREGGSRVPVKASVRQAGGLEEGDKVTVRLELQ